MKIHYSHFRLGFFLLIGISGFIGCQRIIHPPSLVKRPTSEILNSWQRRLEQNRSYWIVDNILSENTNIHSREIFLFIDNNDFDITFVRQIFTLLSREYADPYRLKVTAFSNKDILLSTISYKQITSKRGYFPASPEGRGLYEQEHLRATPLSGYLRAYYYRSEYGETMNYSPSSTSGELVSSQISGQKLSGDRLRFYQIRQAIQEGNLAATKTALAGLKNINTEDENGLSPLMLASMYCKPDILNYLILKRADTKDPVTLILAVDESSFRLIIKHADNINLGIPSNISEADRMECAGLLLKHGARADSILDTGETALMYATSNAKIMNLLIQQGAAANVKTNSGWTAIMYAAYYGHTDSVKLLVQSGVDLQSISLDGWTALKLAESEGHDGIAYFLKSSLESKDK